MIVAIMVNLTRALKSENVGRIMAALQDGTPQTIAQISAKTGVSRVTVRKVLQQLEKKAIVFADGKLASSLQGGKPATLYKLDPGSRFAVGIHLSFNRIYGRLLDLNLELLARTEIAFDHRTDPAMHNLDGLKIDDLLTLVRRVIDELVRQAGIPPAQIAGVGFGGHGVTHFDRGVIETSPHNPSWGRNLHMRDLLEREIGAGIPVYVDNSIRFRTLAERSLGALRDVSDGVVIHCTEGLIAGVMINGLIRRGRNDLSGSIGHMKVNVTDRERCACGGYGCFEMQVVPSRVARRVESLKREGGYSNSTLTTGEDHRALMPALFAAADGGDRLAMAVVGELAEWFSIACKNIILMIDPEIIVMQGVYAEPGDYFRAQLRERLAAVSLIEAPADTAIAYSTLGEEAASLGAAAFVISEEVV